MYTVHPQRVDQHSQSGLGTTWLLRRSIPKGSCLAERCWLPAGPARLGEAACEDAERYTYFPTSSARGGRGSHCRLRQHRPPLQPERTLCETENLSMDLAWASKPLSREPHFDRPSINHISSLLTRAPRPPPHTTSRKMRWRGYVHITQWMSPSCKNPVGWAREINSEISARDAIHHVLPALMRVSQPRE